MGTETAELPAIGIAPDVDIHCAKCLTRSAVFMTGKKYESCTGGKDGKSIENGTTDGLHQSQLGEQTSLHGALAAWQYQSVFGLLPVAELSDLKGLHPQTVEHLLMFYECPLKGEDGYSHYFPLSAISSCISCSLMPTIASPKSSERVAMSLASV